MVIAPIARVTDVQPHPESDKLDIVTIAGKTNVANRPAAGQPRYNIGDYAVVLGENLILPDSLIKHLDMWDHEKNKGGLAGGKGNRTKARRVGGVMSEVALCAVEYERLEDTEHLFTTVAQHMRITIGDLLSVIFMKIVKIVDPDSTDLSPCDCENIAEILGITVYQPPT